LHESDHTTGILKLNPSKDISLSKLKLKLKESGCTINTFLFAMLSKTLAQLYKDTGYDIPVDPVQIMMPMSFRKQGDMELYNSVLGI
jgi:hypothetical protein